jgi:glyoxylase-like metal-dependent hydrolase (beta-lactamase superfamily II)
VARSGSPRALRLALIALGAVLLGAAYATTLFPDPQADRIEAAPGVIGVNTGRGLAWLLHTKHGVVLIDAGMDRGARAVMDELREEGLGASQVHSILITHAHPDHWGGVAAFPGAKVYAGAADVPILQGRASLKGPMAGVLGGMMPPPLAAVEPVPDGQVLDLDGEEVRAIALPGHTPGSTAYLWKDLLFTGDALLGQGANAVRAPPWLFCEDSAQARRSLEKLREVPFTRIADGHVGATADARLRLLRLLRK